MAQIFTVAEDGTIVMDKLALKYTSGSVVHSGFLEITGNLQVDSNVVVRGTITAGAINVEQLVTPNGSLASVGQWQYNTEPELNGKGFSWTWGAGSVQMVYRTGGKIWTNGSIDLAPNASYSIDGIPVISTTALGATITESNLNQVGTLQELKVDGDVAIGDLIFFDTVVNRIGIGTEEPNSTFSIVENGVELGFGSPALGLGTIGTYSSHDVSIVSDNLPRITVKASGEVNIGNPNNGNAVLNVYGTINATNIVSDNRIERTEPLQFQATPTTSIYGLGMNWVGTGAPRQFIMMANPDRLWSTESIDLGGNQAYYLNGKVAISESTLGDTIINSKLQSVGTLQGLNVNGETTLNSVSADSILLNGQQTVMLTSGSINSSGSIKISAQEQNVISGDSTKISIGDSSATSKPVTIFGPLAVNINNPDPSVQFSVAGDVKLGNKKFTNGTQAPATGAFMVGDICWNTNPVPNSYVGWICITSGTPGQWAPFGMIAPQ